MGGRCPPGLPRGAFGLPHLAEDPIVDAGEREEHAPAMVPGAETYFMGLSPNVGRYYLLMLDKRRCAGSV